MARLDFLELQAQTDRTPEQDVIVSAIEGDESFASFVRRCGKGKTVNDLVKQVLSSEGTDAPMKDEETYFSLSHVTDPKTKEGKAYRAFMKLSLTERCEAEETFFFVAGCASFKSYCTRNFEVNGDKKFRFGKNGEPIRKAGKKGTGSDKAKTRKVDDLVKSIQARYDEARSKCKPAELKAIRTILLAIASDNKLDAKLPEVVNS